jgi:C4-dicarboxylate transporter DctQ subunit
VLHRQSAAVPWLWKYTSSLHFSWAQELCIYLFIWMAKFGAAYGVRTGIHIGVDVLVNAVRPGARRVLVTTALSLGAFFTGAVAVMGARWVVFVYGTGQISPDLEWPMWVIYLCIPLGSSLMCYRFLQTMVRFLKSGELPTHMQDVADEGLV